MQRFRQTMRDGKRLAVIGMMASLCLAVPGCADPDTGNAADTTTDDPLGLEVMDARWRNLGGEWAAAVGVTNGDPVWLTLGELNGGRLQSDDGATLAHWDRPLEYLDVQHPTDDGDGVLGDRGIYASFDSGEGRPVLFTVDAGESRFETLMKGGSPDYAVENLCLYRDYDDSLYLFLLGEDHRAHQMLVTGNAGDYHLRPVRTLPTPPGGEYCAVDQASGTLYVSEEDSAIYGYDAHPDTSLARRIVDLGSPWGNLGSGPRDLASDEGQLFTFGRDAPSLHRIDHNSQSLRYHGREQLEGLQGPETLTLSRAGGERHLMLFDEIRERYRHMTLPGVEDPPEARQRLPEVQASLETEPVASPGDAADDPAVWVHPGKPDQSLILGTDKRAGLYVYSLDGKARQFIGNGRVNNVDVRYGARLGDRTVDIAAATNRTTNTISLYAIDRQSRELELVTEVDTDLREIYGFCLYRSNQGELYGFANDKDGTFDQFALSVEGEQWFGERVRRFSVPSQPEGCVADDERERLFLGEEAEGIHAIGANPDDGTETEMVAPVDGEALFADVEGLNIYRGDERDYLVASAQDNNSFAIYEAVPPFSALGAFRIGVNPEQGIDGASETDGVFATSANLGSAFPNGMLVVQDGRNVMPEDNQNFKAVPWERIRSRLGLE